MKTLSEVIERCQGYVDDVAKGWDKQDCSLPYDDMLDALHYLWEYRTEKQILSDRKEHYEYWEHKYYAELEKNDPLDWETLKTMEGKPVWFEWTGSPRWGIVDGIYINAYGVENLVICIPHDYLHFDKRMQGLLWQAYRKETE